MKRPHIVFYFSDQQRWDSLGVNGQSLDVTPCLDAFARDAATNFANAFTPQPVCGPARAMLQTGLFPTQIGCYRNAIPLPADADTLAKRLTQAGYESAYVGKWHLASDEDRQRYETSAVPLELRGGYKDYWRAADVLEFTSHGYDGYVFDENGQRRDFVGYRTDCVTDFALEYLDDYAARLRDQPEAMREQPFFLFLSHIEPHHQNDRGDYEGPDGLRERFEAYAPPADLRPGEGDWERFYPDYLACCHALDRNFGRVLDKLKAQGFYDDTLVVYASDHGCHFRTLAGEVQTPDGYDDYKRNSFENTIRVPLLIKGAGFDAGRRETRLASLIDLPRTLLRAAGVAAPDAMQGRALQDLSETGSTADGGALTPKQEWANEVYIQISESYVGRALRTERYKYVVHAPGQDPWHDAGSARYAERYLFDLQNDPQESRNLLDEPDFAAVKAALRERLLACARAAGETFELV